MQHLIKAISCVLFCTASLTIGNAACAQQFDDPALQAIAQGELKKIGSIDVHGVVVSEGGDPLLGVSVDYDVRKYGDVVAKVPAKTHTMIVDGDFRLQETDISSISVAISKFGYYGVSWEYYFSADTPRQFPDGDEIVDVEIVLKKKPDPAPLDEFKGLLRTSERGPISALNISNPQIPPGPLTGDRIKAWKAHKADLPSLYLEAESDDDGSFVIVKFMPRGQNHFVDGLARGWIKHSNLGPGDGFLIFDPGEVPYRHKLVFRDMNEAPVDGYSPSIELNSTDSPEIVYFYCRIGGRYGKGLVTGRPAVVMEDNGKMALASATVFMNPTGSRNVAYIHN